MSYEIRPGWAIPSHELSMRAVCSSGPGGQNVNKVSTKVQLRFALQESTVLSDGHKSRLVTRFKSYVTSTGELLISCDQTRSLEANKELALHRLREMLLATARTPKIRHKTQPSRGAKERRLAAKKLRGRIKQERRTPPA